MFARLWGGGSIKIENLAVNAFEPYYCRNYYLQWELCAVETRFCSTVVYKNRYNCHTRDSWKTGFYTIILIFKKDWKERLGLCWREEASAGRKHKPSLSAVMYSSRANPAAQYGSDIWSHYVYLMAKSGIACLLMHGKCRHLRVYYHAKGVEYGASVRQSNRVYQGE